MRSFVMRIVNNWRQRRKPRAQFIALLAAAIIPRVSLAIPKQSFHIQVQSPILLSRSRIAHETRAWDTCSTVMHENFIPSCFETMTSRIDESGDCNTIRDLTIEGCPQDFYHARSWISSSAFMAGLCCTFYYFTKLKIKSRSRSNILGANRRRVASMWKKIVSVQTKYIICRLDTRVHEYVRMCTILSRINGF